MDLKNPSPDVQNKGKENISVHFRINIQPIYIYMTKISIIQFFFYGTIKFDRKLNKQSQNYPQQSSSGWMVVTLKRVQ